MRTKIRNDFDRGKGSGHSKPDMKHIISKESDNVVKGILLELMKDRKTEQKVMMIYFKGGSIEK